MSKINILSFAVANLIAAGEVVDRPASVIKELLENSLDSGADRITIEIQNGGVTFMRVSDNGSGIEKDDLAVAVRRHATSKIKEAEDLDGIMSLGFRGEALAAIASVSDLRIISKPKDAPTGAAIEVSWGDIQGVYERGCAEGTTVIAEHLFYNVPARKKFLKKDVTETAAVTAVVEKLALSHPEVAFTFITDGTVKIQTAGDGKLLNTIYSLYGRDFARGLIEISFEYEGIGVKGYAGRPDNLKPNRNAQNFFINGRYIKSKTAAAAVEQAYCSYIPTEKFPVCVLNIEISPKAVDVNVHPAKLEVKFSNEKPVFEAIYYGVKNVLEGSISRPTISPEKLGSITYGEYRKITSTGKTCNGSTASCKYGGAGMPTDCKAVCDLNESESDEPKRGKTSTADTSAASASIADGNPPQSEQITMDTRAEPTEKKAEPSPTNTLEPSAAENAKEPAPCGESPQTQKLTAADYINEFKDPTKKDESENADEGKTDGQPNGAQTTISNAVEQTQNPSASVEQTEVHGEQGTGEFNIPAYRIVGEGFNSYVIVETEKKLIFVDKHAAHERIIFEKLKDGMRADEVQSQILMLPIEFMMTSDEVLILNEYKDEIEKVGFGFDAEKYTVKVNAIPEILSPDIIPEIFMTFADRIKNESGSARLTRDIIFEKALYGAACKSAIKAGREYGPEHVRWIIDRLMTLSDITFCPHGRPVAMEINKSSLDKQFGRT